MNLTKSFNNGCGSNSFHKYDRKKVFESDVFHLSINYFKSIYLTLMPRRQRHALAIYINLRLFFISNPLSNINNYVYATMVT